MTAPVQPVGTGPEVDHVIASFAADAIRQGAPQEKVQGRVAQMMAHLNEHPELRAQARSAIAQGADPAAVVSKIGELSTGRPVENDEPEEPPDPSIRKLGVATSALRHIPGAEAASAGVRALTRGQSYGDALSDIRQADTASGTPGVVADAAGGTLAALTGMKFIPGGPAVGGAVAGGAEGLAEADPKANRLEDAAFHALIGYGAGKAVAPFAKVPLVAKALRRALPGVAEADQAAATKAAQKAGEKTLQQLGKFELTPSDAEKEGVDALRDVARRRLGSPQSDIAAGLDRDDAALAEHLKAMEGPSDEEQAATLEDQLKRSLAKGGKKLGVSAITIRSKIDDILRGNPNPARPQE